jgi:cell division protein FtsI/penicillin-binding protein 2
MSATRIHIIFICFIVIALLFAGRLFSVQVIHRAIYVEKAERQYIKTVPDNFSRGTIYFSSHDGTPFPAATLNYGYRIVMDPSKVEEPEALCGALADMLSTYPYDVCIEATGKQGDQYELLACFVVPMNILK